MNSIKPLVNFAAGLAIVVYVGAIIFLGVPSLHAGVAEDALKYISNMLTGLGGALATFFGAAVGLNQIKSVAGPQALTPRLAQVATLTWLQVIAAWVYFLSLVLAVGLWGMTGFGKETPEAVRSLPLSLPGVFVGILTIVLSLRAP